MIQLPIDAEGREIPLDTEVLFDKDGNEIEVSCYRYYPKVGPGYWNIRSVRNKYYRQDEVHLNPPDSWEKLEEDIRRIGTDDCTWFCGYANENPVENACPDSCKFFKGDEITCRKKLADDILSRIRKLRGENNA